MASDIALHNSIASGTAGIESILSSTPTIFFDSLGCNSLIENNGDSHQLVFRNWSKLWQYLEIYFQNTKNKDINNWSEVIDKLDQFRDGKSNDRINFFLSQLLENLKICDNKNIAIKKTVSTYSQIWGKDKIIAY